MRARIEESIKANSDGTIDKDMYKESINSEIFTDWKSIPDTYNPDDLYVENLKDRGPVTLREYKTWDPKTAFQKNRLQEFWGDYEDNDGVYEDEDFDEVDSEYLDGLDFVDPNEPLESEEVYDEDDEPELFDIEADSDSDIDDSSVIYPVDDDFDDDDFDDGSIDLDSLDALPENQVKKKSKLTEKARIIWSVGEYKGQKCVSTLEFPTKREAEDKYEELLNEPGNSYIELRKMSYDPGNLSGDIKTMCRKNGQCLYFQSVKGEKQISPAPEEDIPETARFQGPEIVSDVEPFMESARYDTAEILLYFETKTDRDKAFSILLDHEEDVYKCDAHYTPAFPGSERKGAIDRGLIIYAELFGSYDIQKKDVIGKDKNGEDLVTPIRHTKYVGMEEEIRDFVEDMASLLPCKVVDYEYRGTMENMDESLMREESYHSMKNRAVCYVIRDTENQKYFFEAPTDINDSDSYASDSWWGSNIEDAKAYGDPEDADCDVLDITLDFAGDIEDDEARSDKVDELRTSGRFEVIPVYPTDLRA